MRSEYITYASFSPEQRDAVTLPALDASQEELDNFWMTTALIRGEQPDSQALPADGALRGEFPISKTELAREVK